MEASIMQAAVQKYRSTQWSIDMLECAALAMANHFYCGKPLSESIVSFGEMDRFGRIQSLRIMIDGCETVGDRESYYVCHLVKTYCERVLWVPGEAIDPMRMGMLVALNNVLAINFLCRQIPEVAEDLMEINSLPPMEFFVKLMDIDTLYIQ